MRISNRLERLEKDVLPFADVIDLIAAGKHFDELTEQQQRAYCLYRFGTETNVEIEVLRAMNEDVNEHIRLEFRPRMKENVSQDDIDEVQRIIEEMEL